jgi:AbrB family transcriptional regulator (stage V sporulation protein T)
MEAMVTGGEVNYGIWSDAQFDSLVEQAINDRITYQAGKDEKNVIQLVDEELEGITAQVIAPIICEGDAIGSVSLMSREPKARFGEMEMKLAVTAAGFLGRQMES